jgi:hypothetical protein
VKQLVRWIAEALTIACKQRSNGTRALFDEGCCPESVLGQFMAYVCPHIIYILEMLFANAEAIMVTLVA